MGADRRRVGAVPANQEEQMVTRHAGRSKDGELDERGEPRADRTEPPAPPTPAEAALQLQRVYGNQAVQRMLARSPRMLQRFEPDFTHRGAGIDKETIATQDECNDAVEALIEEELAGHRALFMRNETATSPGEWRNLVLGLLEEQYVLDGIGAKEVLTAVKWVKDKYRSESLIHLAQVHVFWAITDEAPPWDVDEFKARLLKAGLYLEPEDEEAVEAIFDTGGAFAQTKVQFDTAKNIELLDEDNVVVLIDSHQQKHQSDQITQFPPYSGGKGSKFASGKGLDWHRDNTALVVKATVQQAVESGQVTRTKDYTPSKVPKDGIVYDLIVRYDEPTGKYVGSYHCNPLENED
jgi:hypothetical protein